MSVGLSKSKGRTLTYNLQHSISSMNSPNIPLQSLNPEDNILESAPLAAEFTGTFFVVLTQASKSLQASRTIQKQLLSVQGSGFSV